MAHRPATGWCPRPPLRTELRPLGSPGPAVLPLGGQGRETHEGARPQSGDPIHQRRRGPRYDGPRRRPRASVRRPRVAGGALTVGSVPGRVFVPPGDLARSVGNRRKLASRAICPEQSFGPPGTNAYGEVCARSLLENGIVRAKSQCGQRIRTQTDGLYVNKHYAGSETLRGEEPVVTNDSSQIMVTL
jgi:hypothetical protein